MAYKDVVLADTPLAYWRLDDTGTTAADSAGTHIGTLHGTVTKSLVGALVGDTDTAMGFDGSTGYISVASASDFDALSAAFSYEAWFYKAVNADMGIFEKTIGGAVNTHSALHREVGAGGWVFRIIQGTGGQKDLTFTDATSTGAWHHIVGTFDGSNANLYLDGVLVAGPHATVAPTAGIGTSIIAALWPATPIRFWNGRLDEIAIYNTALSPVKVLAHYNAGIGSGGGGGTGPGHFTTLTVDSWASIGDFVNAIKVYDKGGAVVNAMHPDFGVPRDGSDATVGAQRAIDYAELNNPGADLNFPIPLNFAGTLQWKGHCNIIGSHVPAASAGTGGTTLSASGANNILHINTAATGGPAFGGKIKGIRFTGGTYQFWSDYACQGLEMQDVTFENPATAGLYSATFNEHWHLRNVRFVGGVYGWYAPAAVNAQGGTTLQDASLEQLEFTGQSNRGAWFGFKVRAFHVHWYDLMAQFMNPSSKLLGGALHLEGPAQMWGFHGVNCEFLAGQGVHAALTTGSINAGSASLLLASATGIAVGDTVTVMGAGQNANGEAGDDLITTISTLVGTTATLAAPATVSVTNAEVTNAIASDFEFLGTADGVPGFIGFEDAAIGNSAGLRYSLDIPTNPSGHFWMGGASMTGARPIHDPGAVLNTWGSAQKLAVRRPSDINFQTFMYHFGPAGKDTINFNGVGIPRRSQYVSPAGGDLVSGLATSDYSATGSVGKFSWRTGQTGRPELMSLDPNGLRVAGGVGNFGHAAPTSQPAVPVTLADVIAILRAYGLSQ